MDSLGRPGTLMLVGGSSDIATAVALALGRRRPLDVVVAARPSSRRTATAHALREIGCGVELVDLELEDVAASAGVVECVVRRREVDVVVLAQGVLPDQDACERHPALTAGVSAVGYASVVACGLAAAAPMRDQGHGVIVVLSSVAATRPRPENYLYGSAKAGVDAFARGLRDRLRGSGVHVVLVRPGFVRTRMTAHLAPAPLAVGPEQVADAVVAAVGDGTSSVVWVPRSMGVVAAALRLMPAPLLRRVFR